MAALLHFALLCSAQVGRGWAAGGAGVSGQGNSTRGQDTGCKDLAQGPL